MKVIRLLVGFTLLIGAGCAPARLSEDWRPIANPVEAPDFTLNQLDGPPVTLSQHRGKVVIMEFWATWCGPCRMSTPSLEAIYREHKGKPVSVLLINAGDDPETIRKWADKRFTAPILLDSEGAVRRQYGISGIPHLFILDRRGRIVYDKSGYGGGLERSLRLIIDQLLNESSAAG